MNENKFIKELETQLSTMSKKEREEIIKDYEEHFMIGKSEGRSEESIAKSLGKPKDIAKHIKTEELVKEAEKNTTTSNVLRVILAATGLGLFNAIFIIGPFVGIIGALIGIIAGTIGIIIGGLLAIIISFFEPVATGLGINQGAAIFISLGITSLGCLLIIGELYLVKGMYKLTLKYVRMNLDIITKKS